MVTLITAGDEQETNELLVELLKLPYNPELVQNHLYKMDYFC